jgi:hypothetical protein
MTREELLAIQTVVVEQLQRDAQEHPTLLVDTLLDGDGWGLIHRALSQQEAFALQQEAFARGRADTLRRLLQTLLTERMPPQSAEAPLDYPPVMPPTPGVSRGE